MVTSTSSFASEDWSPGRFENLHSLISDAVSIPSVATAKRLKNEIDYYRPAFVNLLDTPQKNTEQRARLEKGEMSIKGVLYKLNADFIVHAKAISDYMNISEQLSATLLHYGTLKQHEYNRDAVEVAVTMFHHERSWLIVCLELMVKHAEDENLSDVVRGVFNRVVTDLTESTVPKTTGPGTTSFACKILDTIEFLRLQISTLVDADQKPPVENGLTSVLLSSVTAASGAFSPPHPDLLGESVRLIRVQSLKDERESLSTLLFQISYQCQLSSAEIIDLARQLQKADWSDSITVYQLAALLASIDASPERYDQSEAHLDGLNRRNALLHDRAFLTSFNAVVCQSEWAAAPLQPIVLVQWTLFLKVLRNKNTILADSLQFTDDALEQMAEQAILHDAFDTITRYVLRYRLGSKDLPRSLARQPTEGGLGTASVIEADAFGKPMEIEDDFQWFLEQQLQHMVTAVIYLIPSVLRKLKNREEDLSQAHLNQQQQQHIQHLQHSMRRSQGMVTPAPLAPLRQDLAAFFKLVSVLYEERPDAGVLFWRPGSQLFAFLKWGTECRTAVMRTAYYDMLASLATGTESAQNAYNFLQSGGGRHPSQHAAAASTQDYLSWQALYQALEINYASLSRGDGTQMHPDEKQLLQSFLRLLRQVVKFSALARSTLYEHQNSRMITLLFNLLSCQVPVDLKAAILDTIAAFAVGTGIVGAEIAKKIWFMLEDAQVLNTRIGKSGPIRGGATQGIGMGMSSVLGGMTGSLAGHGHYATGIEAELQIESTYETYVETLAFVNLINTLIHSPSRKRIVRIGLGMASPSIPDNLGAGYREPGITPYVEFILNEIFLPALGRGYVDPGEKWKIIESCIRLIEKCLNTFDLHSFVAETMMGSMTPSSSLQFSGRYSTQSPVKRDASTLSNAGPGNTATLATGLLRHPGFFVICQILCQSQTLDTLLAVVDCGVENVNGQSSLSSFTKSVLQGLRVVHRMLQISPTFLEVLVPYLRKLNDTSSGPSLSQIMPMTPPSMDIVLSERNETVVQTALYINCHTCKEIALLSVHILELLAETSYWGSRNLVMLLSRNSVSVEIVQGFAQKLEIDGTEVYEDAFSLKQQKQCDDPHALAEGDAAAPLDDRAPYAQSVNLTILNLLLKNVGLEKSPPTVAHYLLGYPVRGSIADQELMDPRAMEYKTCLHVILDMLAQGISDGKKLTADGEMQGETQMEDHREIFRKALSSITPFFTHHPIHAERCYQLIYRLSVHPVTSSPTMRYLRSRQYFERQIRVMPIRLVAPETPAILFAQLYQRAWILKSVAVELHLTMQNGMRSHASRLLELLYGFGAGNSLAEENQFDVEDELEGGVDNRMSRFEQPLMKMLELFNSLDHVDADLGGEGPEPPKAVHFQNVSFSRCMQTNERGCSVFNMRGVYALLLTAQRQLERSGALNSSHARNSVKEEMKAWVSFFIEENHRRELYHAKFECLSAWRQVVEVTLAECYELLEANGRESILYDLLGAILPKIVGDQVSVQEAENLSTIVISLMTKLRQDRQHQSIIQATAPVDKTPAWNSTGSRLPAERLHGILRSVLEGILRTDGTMIMRGNLYAALLNYLQYTCSTDLDRSTNGRLDIEPFDETASLASSFVSTSSSRVSAHQHSLESGNLSVIHAAGERFLERVCRDASDGPDVWKTVAFSVLDALCVISGKEKTNRIVKFMAARNFLRYFVDSLRQDDVELQEMMNNEEASPNPLFIYQAKMSLFLRIAQRADGANKLLDNGIVEGLIGCDVLRQRPEMDLNVNDFEAFTPPVYQQYHEILQPVLQLFVCMLSTLGKENVGVVHKMISFVDQSSDVINSILKDGTPFVTLSSLGEVRLATGLLYYLSGRSYNQGDGSSVSSLDSHVSSLLPKYLVTERWSSKLVPANEDDREMMQIERPQYPPLPTQVSEWKDSGDRLGKDICRNLLAICQQQTEAGNEEQFTPIFKLSFAILKESPAMLAQGSTTTPTMGMLVLHLREATERFAELRRQHQDMRYKWNNIGVLSVEEIGEIITCVRGDYVEELNNDQKSHLANRILQKFMNEKRGELLSTLFVIETCLVLVQRHLEYWFVRYRPSGQGIVDMASGGFGFSMANATSMPNATENPSKAQVEGARNEARNGLGPVLGKLATVELTKEEVGIGHRTRTSFVQMLVRKIRDVVMQE